MGFGKISLCILGIVLILFSLFYEEEVIVFEQGFQFGISVPFLKKEKKVEEEEEPIGYLSIPSISLTRPLYPLTSSFNTVSKHVEVISSNLPFIQNGNFILAAHSGNANISYFQDLSKLKIGDEICVTWEGSEYTYQVVSFYEVLKSEFEIRRNVGVTTLTLVTCVSGTPYRYVVVAEQV